MVIIIARQTSELKGRASSADSLPRPLAEPHKEIKVPFAPLNYVEAFTNAT